MPTNKKIILVNGKSKQNGYSSFLLNKNFKKKNLVTTEDDADVLTALKKEFLNKRVVANTHIF